MSPGGGLSVMVKPVSARCNLACDYCYYLPAISLYPEEAARRMDPATLERLVADVLANAPAGAGFVWQGGEPTLAGLDFFRRARDLQGRLRAPGQIIENSLQTNGLLVDEAWAGFLADADFLVGVSVDGWRALHDLHRRDRGGGPTFDRAIRSAHLLSDRSVRVNLLAVVTRDAVRHARRLLDALQSEGFRHVQFLPCAEVDPATGRPTPASVGPAEYGDFLVEAFDAWFAAGRPRGYERLFANLLAIAAGEEPEFCFLRESCGRSLVVEWNGDVFPCDFLVSPEWRLGNVDAAPLADLLETPRYRAFTAWKPSLPAACRSCPLLAVCHGGCPAYRRPPAADAEPLFFFCESYRRLWAHAEGRLRALAEQIRTRPAAAPSRNDPCPCGSGRKLKRCCARTRTPRGSAP